jgi:hypothetical protein
MLLVAGLPLVMELLFVPGLLYREPLLLNADTGPPPVRPFRLREKIADAPLWPLEADHRELLSVEAPPLALFAGSILEKLPVCLSRTWLVKRPY